MKRIPLLLSFILFILLCVSSTYWVLYLIKPAPIKKVSAPPSPPPVADVESVATLFGGAMMVVTNFHLKGVIEANPMSESVAILSSDGSPQKAYPMDTQVVPGSELDSVYGNYVLLKESGVKKRVDLPAENPAQQSVQLINPAAPNQGPTVHESSRPMTPVVPDRTARGPRPLLR